MTNIPSSLNFWLSKDRIQNISTIFEHTADEVESAKALLLPCINTCLASTLSAFAFNMTQFDTRNILLLGSLSYLSINGDLSGRLKLISILLAAELYADCEWHLDELDEEDIKCDRLKNLDITVGPRDDDMSMCAHFTGPGTNGEHLEFQCKGWYIECRFVKMTLTNVWGYLQLAEVKVFGHLTLE
ncbi:unnamed protein product [Mytilus edulis]|uniref:Uncharacterized protein n=1 Tax=Mytilus edulis TaxID=6550 RepID=A0A8S3Q4C8_MYTED|nr:unnamed protein product [Mytilus edulis]